MKNSPIKLNSSSKAKLKVMKSPSKANVQSRILCEDSRIRSSVHTIPIKESPSRPRNLKSNFTQEQVQCAKSHHYNHDLILRSGSPMSKSPNMKGFQELGKMKASKSFAHLHQHQNSFDSSVVILPRRQQVNQFVVHNQTLPIMSPTKSSLNERSFIRVENTQSKVQVLAPTARIVSPPKVIQEIHYKISPKQIELQRKVKILQARIGQLHTQKNQIQIKMNESNMRLQYQNRFLKQKLNHSTTTPSEQPRQRSQSAQKGILLISKKLSTQQKQKQNNQICQSCQQPNTLSQPSSQKLIKDLQRSEQNEYHQSKQIHTLKQQLLQTQQMLSKEINKSLQLLQELALKEKQNENIKGEIRLYREKVEKLEQELKEYAMMNVKMVSLEKSNTNLQEEIQLLKLTIGQYESKNLQLGEEVERLRAQDRQMNVTKQLLGDLEQNNQLLIEAIRTLEASVKESDRQIGFLTSQKTCLQEKIAQLQAKASQSTKNYQQKLSYYENEIQNLAAKILDIETELIEKNTQIQQLNNSIRHQQTIIVQKQTVIKAQQNKIQVLGKQVQNQGNYSTANSFYNKNGNNNNQCTKCDDLRKTIIKLNTHLNKSTGFINDPRKTY